MLSSRIRKSFVRKNYGFPSFLRTAPKIWRFDHYWMIRHFPWKSGFVTVHHLPWSNFMPKILETFRAVFLEKCLYTHVQLQGYTHQKVRTNQPTNPECNHLKVRTGNVAASATDLTFRITKLLKPSTTWSTSPPVALKKNWTCKNC